VSCLATYRPSPEVKYGAVHFSKQLSEAVSDFATMDSRGVLGQVAASLPQTARSDALRLDKLFNLIELVVEDIPGIRNRVAAGISYSRQEPVCFGREDHSVSSVCSLFQEMRFALEAAVEGTGGTQLSSAIVVKTAILSEILHPDVQQLPCGHQTVNGIR